jgi:hypothetical protein
LPFLFRQACGFCVLMLTNNCLIFGQPILGRGMSYSCSQRPWLSAVLVVCVTVARYRRWVKIES